MKKDGISARAAIENIQSFKMHRPEGEFPLDADALAAHFVRAIDAGAKEEQIVAAMFMAIKAAPDRHFKFSKPDRFKQIERVQKTIADALRYLPDAALRLKMQTHVSDTLTNSLRDLASRKFCPKSWIHVGVERLSDKSKKVALRLRGRGNVGTTKPDISENPEKLENDI